MSTAETTKEYIDVLLRKKRAVRSSKDPTKEEQVVNKMVAHNRAIRAGMSATQRRAAIIRGC